MRACNQRHKKQDPKNLTERRERMAARRFQAGVRRAEEAKRAAVKKIELEERAREILRGEQPDLPVDSDFRTLNEAAMGRTMSGAAVAALALLCVGGMEPR